MPRKAMASKPAQHVHRDGAVRATAFEEEVTGPTFATHESGEATLKSVVVRENSQPEGEHIRSAQLQFREPSTDNRYEDTTQPTFGDEELPETPPPPTNDELEVEVEEGFVEEMTEPSAPTDGFDEELRAPSQEELALPPDSDTAIKQRQLREEPNTGPGYSQPERFQGPTGTPGFGAEDRGELAPDGDPQLLAEEEQRATEDCDAAFERMRGRKLYDVNLNIAVTGTQGEDYPFECSIDKGEWHAGRSWCDTTYMWKASALCHKPLYFEDEALERYGLSWGPCLDQIVSGAHFFCKLPVLPYCMGVQPPNECVYALGHYRPGNCAPYMIDPVPLSCRGAAFQAGAATGAAFVIP
jgi:hypothetical protein